MTLLSTGARAQRADSAGFARSGTDSATVAQFLTRLQRAVAAHDVNAVARMIDYPSLGFWNGRETIDVASPKQFRAAYDAVFDLALRREIAAVTPDSIFANWQGVMFNSGRVWLYPDSAKGLLIISINEPVQHLKARWRKRR